MMMTKLTGNANYCENFEVGMVYRHARGKTITENEAVTICHMVMNTADAHFNDHRMEGVKWGTGKAVVFGGVTMSIIIGLAYQDTGEQVIRELGMDAIEMKSPVAHGDTVYAFTEVLAKSDESAESGKVTFKHYGINSNNDVIFEGIRSTLIRKHPNL